jgi:hypothetical protein
MRKPIIKNKWIIILALLFFSCSKESQIESLIIGHKNEYWAFKDDCSNTKGIYFQYNQDGSSNKYLLHIDDGFSLFNNDGDLQNGQRFWSLKNESVFVYDSEEYKIEKITNKEIILSYLHYQSKSKKCFIKLTKWIDGPKGPNVFKENNSSEK